MTELLRRGIYIDLQWFAAEDEGRTEEPTEKRLRDAREEGRVVKSADITGAVTLLLCAATIIILARSFGRTLFAMMRYYLGHSSTLDPLAGGITVGAFFSFFARLALPVLAMAFLGSLVSELAQVGFLFTTKPLTPDFSKISPNIVKWAQRSFFSAEGAWNLAKSILKLLIVGTVTALTLYSRWSKLLTAPEHTPEESVHMLLVTALLIFLEGSVLFFILAFPDYFAQRRTFRESLKMTKEQVKDELRQSEGDPDTKARLRRRMQEILSQSIQKVVPEADVVITNPTHYAIALSWKSEEMVAPMVTAKGQNERAQAIKAIAREHDVPMVENRPLARALYATADVGDTVPREYWKVTAEIIAQVYKLAGKVVQ